MASKLPQLILPKREVEVKRTLKKAISKEINILKTKERNLKSQPLKNKLAIICCFFYI